MRSESVQRGDARRPSFGEEHLKVIQSHSEAISALAGRLEDLADRVFGPMPAISGKTEPVPPTPPGLVSSLKTAASSMSDQIVRLDAVVNRLREIA